MTDDVVARCGLRAGLVFDRPLARELARELRRTKAVSAAACALRARPLSEERLRGRLRARGIPECEREAAVAALVKAGYVDDAALARGRAVALAARGWGDAAILERLAGEALPAVHVEAAVAALEPESARAGLLVSGQDPRKAWTLLQRRGFDADTIEGVLGLLDETPVDGLG